MFPDNTQNITEGHKTLMKNSDSGKVDAFVCLNSSKVTDCTKCQHDLGLLIKLPEV